MEKVERASDSAETERCLLEIAAEYGFTTVFGGIVPTEQVSQSEVKKRILLQHFPPEWAARYNSRGYLFRDPILHRLQADPCPFAWHEAYGSCPFPDDVHVIRGEASEFGLRDGYVIPVPILGGDVAAVSFGGLDIDFGVEARAALSFTAHYTVGTVLHHRANRELTWGHVTAREFDCLLWAAEGKTDWEISVILGISRPTVVKHMLSARDKLGAVNRAHAIAMALRTKILR
jgi:LuxR family transcriptional regulator, quorum-sensing system regulator BjaR1